MKSINEVTLLGHVGQDPKVRPSESEVPVCNFSIATNEVFTKGDQEEQRTTWHSIIAWKNLAETCHKFLDKGSRVLVRGRLQTRDIEVEDEKRTKVEVVAAYVVFLDGRKEPATGSAEMTDEDIPF